MGRARTEATQQHTATIVKLRGQSYKWDDIAKIVGLDMGYCCKLYKRALAEIPVPNMVELRDEECRLVSDAIRELMLTAVDDDISPRSRIEAWNAIRGWSEHRARMIGLNAPVKSQVQVITEDHIDAAIRELEAKMALNDTATAPVDARDT